MKINFASDIKTLVEIELLWKKIKKIDGFDKYSTVEKRLDLTNIPISQVAILQNPKKEICGYAVLLKSWDEKDGTRVFLIDLDVLQEYRGQKIDGELLETIEGLCLKRGGSYSKKVIGCNAILKEEHKLSLYHQHKYTEKIILVEMELLLNEDSLGFIKQKIRDLPYQIRLPKKSEYRAVYEMIFLTQIKGTIGETEPNDEDYQNFLKNEIEHLDLGTFVWDKDSIIGQVTVTLDENKAEILEVGVLPEYWRKGIATQIILRTLLKIYEFGRFRIRLHTDAYNRYGARSMYEKIGFRVVDESIRLRKKI